METKDTSIIYQFLAAPGALYSRTDLSAEEKADLFELEEALASLVLRDSAVKSAAPTTLSEEELARFADDLLAGRPVKLSALHTGDFSAVQDILRAVSTESLPPAEVPEILLHVLARARTVGTTKARVPAFLLRLGESTMRAVHSAAQGFSMHNLRPVTVRSAVAETPVEFSDASGFLYQLVRESADRVHLGIRAPEGRKDYKLQLRRDGRLLASASVGVNEPAAGFGGLAPGHYELTVSESERLSRAVEFDIARDS